MQLALHIGQTELILAEGGGTAAIGNPNLLVVGNKLDCLLLMVSFDSVGRSDIIGWTLLQGIF